MRWLELPKQYSEEGEIVRKPAEAIKPQKLALTEHQEQALLFEWADLVCFQYPELWGLAAIPNGGLRHKRTALDLKAEGVKKGFPDIILAAARGKYHGLFIEMKRRRDYAISQDQEDWKQFLEAQGYKHDYCFGFDHAKKVILEYLRLSRPAGKETANAEQL